MRLSLIDIVNILLLVALFGFCAIVWPTLPERLPTHFGLDGAVDGWSDRSLWAWFALPLIAAAVTALLYGIGRLAPRHPELLNVPEKKAYLALSPERRAPVVAVVVESLHIVSAILLAMMIVIQIGSYRTALGHDAEGVILAATIAMVVGMPISALVMVVRIQSRITAALREEREGRR